MKQKPTPTKRAPTRMVCVRVPMDLSDWLQRESKERDQSIGAFIRTLIRHVARRSQ